MIHPTAIVEPGAEIGEGTKVWHFAHIRQGAKIGKNCVISKDVFVDHDVSVGDNCKIENGVYIPFGVTIEDEVIICPNATLTNDKYPRAVSPDWKICETHIRKGASIGAGAVIVCGIEIGEQAMIGAGAIVTKDVAPFTQFMSKRLEFCLDMRSIYPEWVGIHPSVVIPKWVTFGKNVSIHEGCKIGSQGFGFEKYDGKWLHIPHSGGLLIGEDVEIFENCNICRGTINDTIIGYGTKIDVFCHIGHNARIGSNCLITAHSVIGGSCNIGNDVYIGLNSTVKDHISITDGVTIGCGSNVIKDIKEPNTTWVGNPARLLRR